MSDIRQNDNDNKSPVIRYLVYLLIIVTVVAVVAFSRYATSLSGEDSARAAAFDYEITVKLNEKDPELAAKNKGREFTEGKFSSSDPSADVNFAASIYATSKLKEAESCEFDDVARVIDVKITNNSEVAVDAIIRTITEIAGTTDNKGIVWCLLNEGEFNTDLTIYKNLLNRLGYNDFNAVPDNYAELKEKIKAKNAAALSDWNNDAALAPGGGTKTLTFVFWAEHEGAADYGWDFESELEQSIDIKFIGSQID